MMLSACGGNPFLTEWKGEDQFPPFDKIKLEHYVPAVKAGIQQQADEVNAIVTNAEAPTFANTIAAYELSGQIFNVRFNVGALEMLFRIAADTYTE